MSENRTLFPELAPEKDADTETKPPQGVNHEDLARKVRDTARRGPKKPETPEDPDAAIIKRREKQFPN